MPRAMPWCWDQSARGMGVGGEVRVPCHMVGTGTHGSESSQVVLSLLLQLDLLLQPGGIERRSGAPRMSPVPCSNVPPCRPPDQCVPVERRQIVLHSRQAAGRLAGGQGLFLPFPIIVNTRESTKA